MADGDVKRLHKRRRKILETAVAGAEAQTGLQFCVFLGKVDSSHPRDDAETIFLKAGLHERPAVLIVVAPRQRRIELITSPHARQRISDDDAAAAVAAMTASLARGDLVEAVLACLDHLATSAGPDRPEEGEVESGIELPNVIDEDSHEVR